MLESGRLSCINAIGSNKWECKWEGIVWDQKKTKWHLSITNVHRFIDLNQWGEKPSLVLGWDVILYFSMFHMECIEICCILVYIVLLIIIFFNYYILENFKIRHIEWSNKMN